MASVFPLVFARTAAARPMKRGDTALEDVLVVEGVEGITENALADDANSKGANRLSFIVNFFIVVKEL